MGARPELAVKLASLCYHWARLEYSLAFVFAGLLDAPEKGLFEAEILEHIESIRGKTGVIRSLLEHRLDDDKLRAQFNDALEKAVRLAAQRNKYVHGRWALAVGNNLELFKDELVLMGRVGATMHEGALLINADDFDRVLEEISQHATYLFKFFRNSIVPALKPKPE
jgi:hypothetical protein